MNERELKLLFCSALKSGHVKNNDVIPTSDTRIVQEAHFRSFDLLIAAVTKEPVRDIGHQNNLLMRTHLFERFARSAKCRMDCIRFYPVEIKSDDDMLDERLPNQILNAILAFGLSIVVLDKKHSKKARGLKFLPATIICYTGQDDCFEVVSKYDRVISTGAFNIHRASLARALGDTSDKTFSRLAALERIMQKLAFNQIYLDTVALTKQELEFLQNITTIPNPPSDLRRLSKLIKETANMKLTDFHESSCQSS